MIWRIYKRVLKEPMGYNTEAVGYHIEPEDDYEEEDRSRVGYC